jgi:hypothetical protein
MKTYSIQVSKLGQYSITLPKVIVEGKGWQHGTELTFKFGPRGEVILDDKKNGE